MFFCLGLALIVDGVDGPLAREFKVAEVLPRWSGVTLDLIVDFVTYVFVPAYAIAAGVLVVVSGALYFADRQMKTKDNYFRGFPALWNLGAFYLYLLKPPLWLAAAMLVILAILTFIPLKFLHPLRVKHWRPFNVALLVIWAVLALLAVINKLQPSGYVTGPLVAIALYFFVVGLLRAPA